MSTLEIILVAVVWISYGLFSIYQIRDKENHNLLEFTLFSPDTKDIICLFIMIVGAPITFVVRMLKGAFGKYYD